MQALHDIYHPDMYRFSQKPESYWEATAETPIFSKLKASIETDVAIIGGGIAGLSAALHLAKQHNVSSVVLDSGQIGWGASGRAGGFNSGFASKLSLSAMISKFGLTQTREFIKEQKKATELVYEVAEAEEIDIDMTGNGVFAAAPSARAADALEKSLPTYESVLNTDVKFLDKFQFSDQVHSGKSVYGALHFQGGGGIHPLKFVSGLAHAARRVGAQIYTTSRVIDWQKSGDFHILHTSAGSVKSRRVIVATNAYLSDGLHKSLNRRILPVASNIIVTRELEKCELERAGYRNHTPVYTTNNQLFYYRLLPCGRFLFGGRGDTIGSIEAGEQRTVWLINQFQEMFPAWKDVDVEYKWNGLVCMTLPGVPALGCLPEDPSTGFAFGCHGSGINNATWMGREIARVIAADDPSKVVETIPEVVRNLPNKVLGPRRAMLRAAFRFFSAVDAWENRAL